MNHISCKQKEQSGLANLFYALLGNAIEFYDFLIYAFLAVHMSRNFFPEHHPKLAILAIYGIHFISFLARPLGAIVIGHIGDKVGRKKGLSISILFTGASTFCIGLLPNYESVGILSTLVLLSLKFMQGLGVSGEQSGAIVYLTEHFGTRKRGLVCGLIQSSVFGGILLGSLVIYILNACFTTADIREFAWRIPFLISLPLCVLCWWGRASAPESHAFSEYKKEKSKKIKLKVFKIFIFPR